MATGLNEEQTLTKWWWLEVSSSSSGALAIFTLSGLSSTGEPCRGLGADADIYMLFGWDYAAGVAVNSTEHTHTHTHTYSRGAVRTHNLWQGWQKLLPNTWLALALILSHCQAANGRHAGFEKAEVKCLKQSISKECVKNWIFLSYILCFV